MRKSLTYSAIWGATKQIYEIYSGHTEAIEIIYTAFEWSLHEQCKHGRPGSIWVRITIKEHEHRNLSCKEAYCLSELLYSYRQQFSIYWQFFCIGSDLFVLMNVASILKKFLVHKDQWAIAEKRFLLFIYSVAHTVERSFYITFYTNIAETFKLFYRRMF